MDGKKTRRIREKQSHVLFVLIIIGDTVRLLYLGVDIRQYAGSLKMDTALEYSTRVVHEKNRLCKKSILNDLEPLTPLRIPLMNPPILSLNPLNRVAHTPANPLPSSVRQLITYSVTVDFFRDN